MAKATVPLKDYVYGEEFTNDKAVVHKDTAHLGAVEQCWVIQLANYKHKICYRSGQQSKNADPFLAT